MAIKSIQAKFGTKETVFLGGTTVLNILGEITTGGGVPGAWKTKLDQFIGCKDGESFALGGNEIIKTGFYVKAKGIEFKETEHGDKGPAYWELAKHAGDIAKTELAALMRAVIAAPTTKIDPWPATLTAAMFLSEVVRNPRSFVINLMLLDMIEKSVTYGSGGTKELDFASLLTYKPGKEKTYQYATASVTVGGSGVAGTVRGGKLPMSQLDAMKQYQSTSENFDYQKNFGAYAKQAGLKLQASATEGQSYQYPNPLLEKECTVALRWLLAYFAKKPLKFVTGQEKQNVLQPAVWGKAATTVEKMVDLTSDVQLTGSRENARQKGWTDAATTPATGNTKLLLDSCRTAFRSRQASAACLL